MGGRDCWSWVGRSGRSDSVDEGLTVVCSMVLVVGLVRTVLLEGAVGGGGVLDRLILRDVAVDGDALRLTLVRGGRVWVFPAWRTMATLAMSCELGV